MNVTDRIAALEKLAQVQFKGSNATWNTNSVPQSKTCPTCGQPVNGMPDTRPAQPYPAEPAKPVPDINKSWDDLVRKYDARDRRGEAFLKKFRNYPTPRGYRLEDFGSLKDVGPYKPPVGRVELL